MTGIFQGASPLVRGETPRRHGLGLSWLGKLGHLPSGSLPLFPSDTSCIVQGISGIPCCSPRSALVGTETPVCLRRSVCTACTLSLLGGNAACLSTNTACLELSAALPALHPGWIPTLPVWGLTLPA